MQQVDSGTCADISLILIKNILDTIQSIQSIEDIVNIIENIRVEYNSTELEAQVKPLDSRITSKIDVLIEQEEQNQSTHDCNNELALQLDNIDAYPLELIGDTLFI